MWNIYAYIFQLNQKIFSSQTNKVYNRNYIQMLNLSSTLVSDNLPDKAVVWPDQTFARQGCRLINTILGLCKPVKLNLYLKVESRINEYREKLLSIFVYTITFWSVDLAQTLYKGILVYSLQLIFRYIQKECLEKTLLKVGREVWHFIEGVISLTNNYVRDIQNYLWLNTLI